MRQALGILLLCVTMNSSAERPITLFAAASMTAVMQQLSEQFTQISGHPIRLVVAASSTLARQITRGAPADVYLSANPQWMHYAQAQNALVTHSITPLVHNTLVLIAPIHSTLAPIDVHTTALITQLAGGRLAMADPDHVPAGLYGKAALQALSQWSALKSRLTRSRHVRAALALVERGEAPLGLVYFSDAHTSNKVKILATFPATYPPIQYQVALTRTASANAQQFFDFLTSATAQQQFINFGFKAISDE